MSTAINAKLPTRSASRSMPALTMAKTPVRFSRVYTEYKDALYTYVLFRVGHDRDAAEDIVSDVFVKAYRSFGTYKPEYAISTWLYTITRNTLIDYYRKGRAVVDIDEVQVVDETDPLYRLVTEDISLSEVEAALAALPERQQVAIRGQFFEGKTAKEIAAETGATHAAVRQHVSRGVATLRAALLSMVGLISEASIQLL